MPKSTLEYIAALGRISCFEIKCPGKEFVRQPEFGCEETHRKVSGTRKKSWRYYGLLDVMRVACGRESQLGHASTDGEDTAVNQGASKLDNTIRLWPIPVVFDGVKPERMLLMSHQTRDAPAALESRCGGAGMSAADTTGRRGSSLYYDADTPSPTSTPNRRPQKLDGDSALRGRPLVGPKWRRLYAIAAQRLRAIESSIGRIE